VKAMLDAIQTGARIPRARERSSAYINSLEKELLLAWEV
jgi:hypothetical protein